MPKPKPQNKFIEDARRLGLDNAESTAAFERAMRRIIPPKDGKTTSCEAAKAATSEKGNKS